MTLLGGFALGRWLHSSSRWVAAALIALLTGILVEIAQALMGVGRTGEWQDVVANGVGVLAALLLLVGVRFFSSGGRMQH
jgi:VanZ family protein